MAWLQVRFSTCAQVFAALRSDFSTRRRERCVRVDFTSGLVTGVDELERLLRDAFKATFEARAAAYDEEVSLFRNCCVLLLTPAAVPRSTDGFVIETSTSGLPDHAWMVSAQLVTAGISGLCPVRCYGSSGND